MTRVSQLWDQIETWGFCEDIKDVKGIGLMMMMMEEEDNEVEDNDKDNDNNKDDKNDKGISSLGPPQKAHCATTKIQISQC